MSDCTFVWNAARTRLRCAVCGIGFSWASRNIPKMNCPGAPSTAKSGPSPVLMGNVLRSVIYGLGITGFNGCGCKEMIVQMNALGIAGCVEQRDMIVGHLRKVAERAGWQMRLNAGVNALKSGLAQRIDWLDPYPGLLDEALRIAKERSA